VSEVVGILLAAGRGQRFGSHKLLATLPSGDPIGVASARSLVRAVPASVAVIRPGDRELGRRLSALGLRVIENPGADEGMGASLAAGVTATADATGWLIALADMPWIRPRTIRTLADGLAAGASLIAPVHRGRRGHPVGFARKWRGPLQSLAGDEGARHLLADHAAELTLRPTTDFGTLRDVDLPPDLYRA
jgi:molybdenum cofactor cytidylyltransferase